MAELTTTIITEGQPSTPVPPRDPSLVFDLLAGAGVLLLTVAGWLVSPALGIAVLGCGLVTAGVIGGMTAARTKKEEKTK